MVRTTERIVDILRRIGPGALSVDRLRTELRRHRLLVVPSRERLRTLAEHSEGRLLLLELEPDVPDGASATGPLGSWMVLMAAQDAPDRCRICHLLWRSLSSLAGRVEPTSRVSVSRWILQACRARRIYALIGNGIGPPGPPHPQFGAKRPFRDELGTAVSTIKVRDRAPDAHPLVGTGGRKSSGSQLYWARCNRYRSGALKRAG